MRIVAWNVAHQTRLSELHANLAAACIALRPDVLILNEYVHDEKSRSGFTNQLGVAGLVNVEVSKQVMRPPKTPQGKPLRNNQILIASRETLQRGSLQGPDTHDNGGVTNFLHVRVGLGPLELVGLRVPAYETAALRLAYWEKLSELIANAANRHIVFVGDFNADPDARGGIVNKIFRDFRGGNWTIPSATGASSFGLTSRIDHALASPSVSILSAEYKDSVAGLNLSNHSLPDPISDHAALVVEIAT